MFGMTIQFLLTHKKVQCLIDPMMNIKN